METPRTVGQVLYYLRQQHGAKVKDLQAPLNLKPHRYYQVEKDIKELSLLVAVKLCAYYGLALDEFISLIGPAEFERKDLDTLKFEGKREKAGLEKAALETAARMIKNGIVPGEATDVQ